MSWNAAEMQFHENFMKQNFNNFALKQLSTDLYLDS